MTQPPMPSRRRAPWHAANLVVSLSLATSATAHVGAGGLLPGLPGIALLLLVMGLLWLLSSRTTRTAAGLVANFSLGQLACHVAYQVGSMAAPTLVIAADGSRHWGDPMAGHPMAAAAGHTAGHAAHLSGSMAGMDHGSGGMWSMVLAHAAAVVVSTLVVLALRHLPGAARRWARSLTPSAPAPVLATPAFRTPARIVAGDPRWALAPPPPRRGPPVTL